MRRAVFSDLQRKGLEKRFQIQKYISKPDRKKLAEKLGLKDSQVSLFRWKKKIRELEAKSQFGELFYSRALANENPSRFDVDEYTAG